MTRARRQVALGAAAGPGGIMMDALRTGAVFSLLQGAFYQARRVVTALAHTRRCADAASSLARSQVGQMMSGGKKAGEEDVSFLHTRHMLFALGLQRFERNFQKGQLDDLTLPLLTDSALKEVKIPPGPRLRILQHVAYSVRRQRGDAHAHAACSRVSLPAARRRGAHARVAVRDAEQRGGAAVAGAAVAGGAAAVRWDERRSVC